MLCLMSQSFGALLKASLQPCHLIQPEEPAVLIAAVMLLLYHVGIDAAANICWQEQELRQCHAGDS